MAQPLLLGITADVIKVARDVWSPEAINVRLGCCCNVNPSSIFCHLEPAVRPSAASLNVA